MTPGRPRDCPCGSGERFARCCGPLHEGARQAASPAELMRSRYSAFAVGAGTYLVDTLSKDHPDRLGAPTELARALARARERQRFMGLTILDAPPPDEATGEVLFFARVFEKGRDLSFAELSTFTREDGAWRYASGITVPRERLPSDPTTLDRATFLALS